MPWTATAISATKSIAMAASVVAVVTAGFLLHAPRGATSPPERTSSDALSRVTPPGVTPSEPTRRQVAETLGQLPLRFEANAGQFDARAQFAARGLRYGMWLTSTGAVLSLENRDGGRAALQLSIVGARDDAAASGEQPLPGVTNYYRGRDRANWQTGVRTFERVRYTGVYEGVDVVYYGNQARLEYDFELAAGRDPSIIRLRVDGAKTLGVDADGDLVIGVPGGEPVRQHKPVTYQMIDGVRHDVESRYVLHAGDEVGFEVGEHDRAHPLTIDPILAYSSYFGGTSQETIYDIALDPAGNIYVTGRTEDLAGFPTTPGAFQPTKPGPVLTQDGFVSKFNPAGSALIYSTFLGGSGTDNNRTIRAGRIAVDAAGNAYVAGDTASADFPVSGDAADSTYGGGFSNPSDAYYVKLGPTGTFLYGTFIGGSDYDWASGIAVDATGNVYVTGATRSDSAEGFPQTANAYSGTISGTEDAYLTKFNAGGARVYSTVLGGTGGENTFLIAGGGVAVDDAGRAYVAGETWSTNFPIVGGYQATFGGGNSYDVFLAVIDTTLSGTASLVYSSYLGGTGQDLAYSVAYAGNRQAVVVGEADPGFPVLNAIDATHNGGNTDAFVAMFDTSLTGSASLRYSTYLGGDDNDFAWDVTVDPQGNVHVVGETESANFPTLNPIRTNFFVHEPFLVKINAAGTALMYSTLFGIESNFKKLYAIAANAAGDTFAAGGTNDTNSPTGPTHFPRVNAFQSTYGGGDADAIIVRIADAVDLLLTKAASPEPVAPGGTLTYTLTLTNASTAPALSVTVTDSLPAGVTFVSCAATNGGACGGSGNARTITYASLAAGASSTITIAATVTAGMGATIVNTATVTSASFEPNVANNTATATSHTPGINPNDTDGDALPNDWETRFGLDPNSGTGANGAGGDPDGDGKLNLTELEEGSHPRGFVITFFAEGATGDFFDTRIALANPTSTPALVLTRFQRDDSVVVPVYTTIQPHSRATIDVDDVPNMGFFAFSTLIEADVQIVADRTMSWDETGYGGHTERGTLTRAASTWYLAEGAASDFFDLFYLIQNPNDAATTVEVTLLRPAPLPPIVNTYDVARQTRFTLYVDDVPGLGIEAVSGIVRSLDGAPIVVERAMYGTLPGQPFAAGHNSAGVTAPATRWFLAEGATGSFFDLFVLIANPNPTDAAVDVQFLLDGGAVVTRQYNVAANSRFTLPVDTVDPQLEFASLSTVVTSTNSVPIVVERVMWWPSPNWAEAHNSPGETTTGVRWAMAEGESGGTRAKQTYVLIANTSTFAGQARVTLLFEDGTTAEHLVDLQPTSRVSVPIDAARFPASVNRRYGVVVDSLGTTPAQIVVERALYWNANGVQWAAGTNALATKLQ